MKRLLAVLVVGIAAGCSSSGGDGAGSSGVDAPCGDLDTVVVDGTLGGKAIRETGKLSGYAFVNLGKPSKFDGSWAGGSMHLEWPTTLASGQTTDLQTGSLTLASTPDPRVFQRGTMVYDSPFQGTESTLKSSLTFDTGTVTVCIHRSK